MDTALNEKYRQDAFRVFISGLKKSLRDVLLSSQPKDMPHAFALAEELDGNRERYNFAANYSKYGEYRDGGQKKIPHPNNNNNWAQNNVTSGNQEGGYKRPTPYQSNRPEPLDIDRSISRLLSIPGRIILQIRGPLAELRGNLNHFVMSLFLMNTLYFHINGLLDKDLDMRIFHIYPSLVYN